jgi:dihydroorotate dehydrogenase electron transfer subunit
MKAKLRIMKHFISKIRSNVPVSDSFYELTLSWDDAQAAPLPGQFCTIRVSDFTSPLLRRPFAFSRYDAKNNVASVLYKKRGAATALLAGKAAGDSVDIIGPLGNDFLRPITGIAGTVYLVAGGTGLGPVLFTGITLQEMKRRFVMVLGCRTASQVPRTGSLSSVKALLCTDDGSEGVRGTPLDYLATVTQRDSAGGAVCACGPLPLLQGCHEWAEKRGIPCFVSMEQVMACGVGACMGCAVRVKDADGFARACTEGPVFDSKRIAWT